MGGVVSEFPVAALIQVSVSEPVPNLPVVSSIPLALTARVYSPSVVVRLFNPVI